MRLSVEISLDQLIRYIKQLSFREKEQLVTEIQQDLLVKESESEPNALQMLLLQGPTWSDKEYQDYLKTRNQLDQLGDNDIA
jgi:hypothetical protein